jgi:hypothetical protein
VYGDVVMAAGATHAWRIRSRWLLFVAVLVPLTVLLVLQYRALSELQETTALARRMSLKGYAKSILRGVEGLYGSRAELRRYGICNA